MGFAHTQIVKPVQSLGAGVQDNILNNSGGRAKVRPRRCQTFNCFLIKKTCRRQSFDANINQGQVFDRSVQILALVICNSPCL